MKNIYTRSNECFSTPAGIVVSYEEILTILKKNVEYYGRTRGKELPEEELKDLFEDCILKILKLKDTFDPRQSKLSTWVSIIAEGRIKDAFKKYSRRRGNVSLVWEDDKGNDYIPCFVENAAGLGDSPDRIVEITEVSERVRCAINSLPDNYRKVLYHTEMGRKPKEIASLLGCSAGNVSVTLNRARKALLKKLGYQSFKDLGLDE